MNSVTALFSYTLSVSAIRAVSDSADSGHRCNLNSGTRNPFVENSESRNRVLGGGALKKSRNPFVGIFFFRIDCYHRDFRWRYPESRNRTLHQDLPRTASYCRPGDRSIEEQGCRARSSRECERDEKRLGRGEPHEPKGSVRIRGGTESRSSLPMPIPHSSHLRASPQYHTEKERERE